jgi:methionyl-tRNA formyltransferase
MVLFGKSSLLAHYQGYIRLRRGRALTSPGGARSGQARRTVRTRRTVSFLNGAGIPCRSVRDVNAAEGVAIVRRFDPRFVVVTLDQIVSREHLSLGPVYLNAHYGNLPAIRGWNASEWSLLVEGSLSVSLHRVTSTVDGGEIYLRRPVELSATPDLADVREACQTTALGMYRDFFEDPDRYLDAPLPNDAGKSYYLMAPELRLLAQEVARRIAPDPRPV